MGVSLTVRLLDVTFHPGALSGALGRTKASP